MKEKLLLGAVCAVIAVLIPARQASAQYTYQMNNQLQSIQAEVVNNVMTAIPRYYWVVEVQFIFVGYDTTYWGVRLETYDKQEALEYYLLALTAKQNGLLDQMFPPQGRWFPVDVRWRKVDRYAALFYPFAMFSR
ncbi:MAG: hypothetical protein ACR2NP_02935 [Pirellulaceae bacterium]